jgi:hypothetical protein
MDRAEPVGRFSRIDPNCFVLRYRLVAQLDISAKNLKGDHAHGSILPWPKTASQILR